MKLEEKIINKVLHYRWYEDADFKPYTLEELTSIIYKLKETSLSQDVYLIIELDDFDREINVASVFKDFERAGDYLKQIKGNLPYLNTKIQKHVTI